MRSRARCLAVLATLLCVLLVFALCACDGKDEEKVSTTEKSLYLADVAFSDEGDLCVATLAFGGEESKKLDSVLIWKSTVKKDGAMYTSEDVEMSVGSQSLYAEVSDRIFGDGASENCVLKAVLEYGTIYKSIKSDATVIKSDGRYLHRFAIDQSLDTQTFALHLKNPNSAGWYSVLIASVLGFGAVVALTVYLVRRKRKIQH